MSFEECPRGGQHEWKEVYYGTECAKCKTFYPDGCEPWDPRNWEDTEYLDDAYEELDGDTDYNEPTDSCENCGCNIYGFEDDGSGLCDQCAWSIEAGRG